MQFCIQFHHGLFPRDRHLHLPLAAEALAKAEGQAKSKIQFRVIFFFPRLIMLMSW